MLRYIVETLTEVYRNVFYSTHTTITIVPTTAASAERNFSALKLIKTYLRATMAVELLMGLAFLLTENDVRP
jgi:hypothetical protein